MNSVNQTSEIGNQENTNWPQVVENIFSNISGKNMENGKFLISTKLQDTIE